MIEDSQNNEILLRRFLSGEPDACNVVEGGVRRIALYWNAPFSREDREDLIQQTLMEIYLAIAKPEFELKQNLLALARKIAARRCIDQMRKYRPIDPIDDQHKASNPSPYKDLELKDEIHQIRLALDGLDSNDREVIRRRFLKEESYSVIVTELGRDENYWRGRVFHGIMKIRKSLGVKK
jgi:RNA polymerase sigma factor (sigma-70 family)